MSALDTKCDTAECSGCGASLCGGFVCIHCHKAIPGAYVYSDDPLLTIEPPSDHPCRACGELLYQSYVVAQNTRWHHECFSCTNCGCAVTDLFYSCDGDGRVYHPWCLSAGPGDCYKCLEPLEDWVVYAGGACYHPRCYRCEHCQEPIELSAPALPNGKGGMLHEACAHAADSGICPAYVVAGAAIAQSMGATAPQGIMRLLQVFLAAGLDVGRVATWDSGDVTLWLTLLGMRQYVNTFAARRIGGAQLHALSMDDFLKVLALPTADERQWLSNRVTELRQMAQLVESAAPPQPGAGAPAALLPYAEEVTTQRRTERTVKHFDPLNPKLPPSFIPTDTALSYYRTANRPDIQHTLAASIVVPSILEDRAVAETPRSSNAEEASTASPMSARTMSVSSSVWSGATRLTSMTGASQISNISRISKGSSRHSMAPRGYIPDPLNSTAPPINPLPDMGRVVPSGVSRSQADINKAKAGGFTEAPLQPLPFRAKPQTFGLTPFVEANEYYSTARVGVAGVQALRHHERAVRAQRRKAATTAAGVQSPAQAAGAATTALGLAEAPEATAIRVCDQSMSRHKYASPLSPALDRASVRAARGHLADAELRAVGLQPPLPLPPPRQIHADARAPGGTPVKPHLGQDYDVTLDYDVDYKRVAQKLDVMLQRERKRVVHFAEAKDMPRVKA